MESIQLVLNNPYKPQILFEAKDFLLVYKPPKMHSAPGKGMSLSQWCAILYPEILKICRIGKAKENDEGGLFHRLDFETQGLVLFARNQEVFDRLQE
jgi:23S rRNA pseudouridine1911/1915/1917 synthase